MKPAGFEFRGLCFNSVPKFGAALNNEKERKLLGLNAFAQPSAQLDIAAASSSDDMDSTVGSLEPKMESQGHRGKNKATSSTAFLANFQAQEAHPWRTRAVSGLARGVGPRLRPMYLEFLRSRSGWRV
jgi:hypothetical protein